MILIPRVHYIYMYMYHVMALKLCLMQYYVNMHVSEPEGLNMYSDIHYIMSDVILLHHEWLRAGLTLTGLDKDYLWFIRAPLIRSQQLIEFINMKFQIHSIDATSNLEKMANQ